MLIALNFKQQKPPVIMGGLVNPGDKMNASRVNCKHQDSQQSIMRTISELILSKLTQVQESATIQLIEFKELKASSCGNGVYVIFGNEIPLYVGQTCMMLKGRLNSQHYLMTIAEVMLELGIVINIAFIPGLIMDDLEQILIKSLNPRFNKEGVSKIFSSNNSKGVAGSRDTELANNLKWLLNKYISQEIKHIPATQLTILRDEKGGFLGDVPKTTSLQTVWGFLKRKGIYDYFYQDNKYKGISLENAKKILSAI